MIDVAMYAAPAAITDITSLELFVRAEVMVNQFNPLPSIFALALTPAQWSELYTGLPDDVARYPVHFIGSTTFVLPYSTAINPHGGYDWEMTAIRQGWWNGDPPGVKSAAKIPPGPQFGQQLGTPNFAIADLLFMEGSWAWLLWA